MPNEYDDLVEQAPAPEPKLAAAPAPEGNPYSDVIDQQAGAQAAALRLSMAAGVTMKPEEHAKALALSDQSGIPAQVVARNLQQVQQRNAASGVDYAAMQRKHPELAEWLSNPDHAGIAHPDVDALHTLSSAVQAMAHPEWDVNGILPPGFVFSRDGSIEERIKQPDGGVLANTYPDLHAVSLELASRGMQADADAMERAARVQRLQQQTGIFANVAAGAASSISATESLLGTASPDQRAIAQRIAQASSDISPGFGGDVQRFTGSMLADVPLLLSGGPLAEGAKALMATGRASSVLARLGLEGSERAKAGVEVAAAMQPFAIRQAAQTSDEQGAAQGAMDWLINSAVPGAFGKLGIGKVLTEGMGAANAADGWSGVAKRLLYDAAGQGAVGASTYAATALERLATGGQGAPADAGEFFRELAKNGALGALAGTAFNLGPAVGDKFHRDALAAHAAVSFEDKAALAVDSLKAAKVNELAPERVQGLLDKILGDGAPKTVYLQGKDFQDHALAMGEDPANKADALGLGKEYREAQALGHDMAIPTSVFLQEAARAENPKELLGKVKQTADAKSAEEAREFVSEAPKELDEQTKAAVAKLDEHNASPEGARELAEIHDEIKRQLIEAGTGEGVAERQAEVTAATFRTIAQRQTMGGNPTTAMDLLRQFPLTIQRELPAMLRSREHQSAMDAMLDAIRKYGVAQPAFERRAGADDDRHADILSEIERQGGMAKKAKDQEGGDYDDMPTLRGAHAKIMGGDLKPDQMAHALQEAGHGDGTVPTMWRLVEDAIAQRSSAKDREPQPLATGEESLAAIKRQLDAIGVDLSKMTNAQAREAIAKHTEATSYSQGDEEPAPVDTSHLSLAARNWLSALKPQEVKALESSIAHFAQHPDPAGDMANLQMVHDFMAKPRRYKQPSDEKPSKGSITFGKDGPAVIRLFQGADESTFMHEMGHFWLEVMGHLASRENATEQVRQDYAAVLKWMGVEKREDIQVEHHELWARGFERYLMEGRAPSSALRRAFQAFKTWLSMIYRSIGALKSELSPEVRAVMDRLVATDDEIAAAQDRVGGAPNFANREESGFDEKTWDEYQKAVDNAREEAETKLRVEALSAEHAAYTEKWNRQRDEYRGQFAEQVNVEPVYKAIAALQRGTEPDGTTLPDALRGLKLDRADLVARYGEERLKDLPGHRIKGQDRPNAGQKVYATEGGISLDDAASMFGFPHANALWEAMVNAPDRRALINDLANSKMREQYPDPLLNGTLPEKADQAIQTADALAKRLTLEVQALGLRVGQRAAAYEVLRQFARQRVGETQVRDLSPNRYKTAQAKAARDAFKAAATGKYDEAFISKQREMFNYAMHRETLARQEAAQKQVEYIRSLQKHSAQERIGKAGGWEWTVTYADGTSKTFTDQDAARKDAGNHIGAVFNRSSSYLDQVNKLLERFDFSPKSNRALDRRASLNTWIRSIEYTTGDDGREVPSGVLADIPQSIRDEALSKSYKELTSDELQDVKDSLANIASLARLKNELLKNARMRDLVEAVASAKATIEANSRGAKTKKVGRGLGDSAADAFGRLIAAHRKVSSYLYEMDGFKDGGFLFDLWQRPLNEAHNAELLLQEKGTEAMARLLKQWGKVQPFNVTKLNLRGKVPGIPQELNHWSKVMVALNWGNAGNRDRLMKSYNWTAEQVRGIIDTLDKKDMAFVQGVLDHVNSYWSEIKAKQERVTGIAPEKVEALPIETHHGTYAGGYFPIKYERGAEHEAITADTPILAVQGAGMRAQTARGHTEARTGMRLGDKIRLDPSVITQHLNQVIHDLSHHETLIDLSRIMANPDFRNAVEKHWGENAFRQFRSQLVGVAVGSRPAEVGWDRFWAHLRLGGFFAMRTANLGYAVQQLGGLPFVIGRVGIKHFATAMAKTLATPFTAETGVRWVEEQSVAMRNRSKTRDKNISDAMGGIGIRGPVRKGITSIGWWPVAKIFQLMDAHTFIAAYDKAMEDGTAKNHDDAVAIAEQTVSDLQGGGTQKDMAAVQRGGELAQILTSSMSWFLSQMNVSAESFNRARAQGGKQWVRYGWDMFVYYGVCTAAYAALRTALTGEDKDAWSDPEKIAKKLAGEAAYSAAGNFVLLRELGPTLQDGSSYKGPQSMRALGYLADAYRAVSHAAGGHPLTDSELRALARTAGTLFHVPAEGITQMLEGIRHAEETGGGIWQDIKQGAFGPPPKRR